MAEYIGCRECDSRDCKGCNLKKLETMLKNGKFDCLMNGNRCINPFAYVAPVQEWISVKDRLPESDDEFVLVLANGKPSKNITLEEACELATYSAEDGWILEMWPDWTCAKITYWMQLPELPKGE